MKALVGRDAPVIIEAGANRGDETAHLLSMWAKCTIHAFEPVPQAAEELRTRFAADPRVHVYPLALGESAGRRTLHLSGKATDDYRQSYSSSLLKPSLHLDKYPIPFEDTIEVDVVALDDWGRGANVDAIDLMWLDMQGGEYAMLMASTELLRRVRVVYMEVSHVELYAGMALFPEVKRGMAERGFLFCGSQDEDPGVYGNALFARV